MLFPQQAEKNDGLSEIICKDCLKRLHIAYHFKKEAVKSNNEMLSFLSKVNKDYQQLTVGSAVKAENQTQNDSVHIDGVESYDELDDEMEALVDEHHLEMQNENENENDIDDGLADDNERSATDEGQGLVEILGASDGDVFQIQDARSIHKFVTVQETANDEQAVNLIFLEDNVEIDSNDSEYVVNEYNDENAVEMITDGMNEPQYLDYDENDDQLYDEVGYLFWKFSY